MAITPKLTRSTGSTDQATGRWHHLWSGCWFTKTLNTGDNHFRSHGDIVCCSYLTGIIEASIYCRFNTRYMKAASSAQTVPVLPWHSCWAVAASAPPLSLLEFAFQPLTLSSSFMLSTLSTSSYSVCVCVCVCVFVFVIPHFFPCSQDMFPTCTLLGTAINVCWLVSNSLKNRLSFSLFECGHL